MIATTDSGTGFEENSYTFDAAASSSIVHGAHRVLLASTHTTHSHSSIVHGTHRILLASNIQAWRSCALDARAFHSIASCVAHIESCLSASSWHVRYQRDSHRCRARGGGLGARNPKAWRRQATLLKDSGAGQRAQGSRRNQWGKTPRSLDKKAPRQERTGRLDWRERKRQPLRRRPCTRATIAP